MIQSKTTKTLSKSTNFPKLMQLRGCLEEGVVVYAEKNSVNKIGEKSTAWIMDYFEDFDGKITMKNV